MLTPTRTAPAAGLAAFGAMAVLIGFESGLLIAITVVAAALRFATLAHQSYWLDEAQAVHEVSLSFGGMLHAWSGYEGNPPLYLILAWIWARVFGTGEAGLRSLSAVLGVGVDPAHLPQWARACLAPRGPRRRRLRGRQPVSHLVLAGGPRVHAARVHVCRHRCCSSPGPGAPRAAGALIGWAVFSGLALLTQYFAGFLVAAEGLLLVYRLRSRASMLALAAMGVLEAALIPHVTSLLSSPPEFIVSVPLSVRLQQVPVSFAMNTLYQTGIVTYGLIGAAALAAVVIALLVAGAEERELRGAGVAAAWPAAVLIVPLLLALTGHDDYIARGLLPAWAPLAITIAAACTAARARRAGAVLAVVVLAMFIYAGVRIDRDPQLQKVNWRGVAAALGPARRPRAIVAYDGMFATAPLSLYLPARAVERTGAGAGAGAGLGHRGRRHRQRRRPCGRRLRGCEADRHPLGGRVRGRALRARPAVAAQPECDWSTGQRASHPGADAHPAC